MLGYIGLGNMGGALAHRLAKSQQVKVYDLNAEARARLVSAGATEAGDTAEIAKDCDIIFLCLPTPKLVEELLFGENGLAAKLSPGTIIIDQTSGEPETTRRFGAKLAEGGVTLVDAPVSGGPQGADAGTIAIMVGADPEAYARVEPVLKSISPNVFHTGGLGNGHVSKLCNNLLSSSIRLATMEAIALASKNGVAPEVIVKILNAGGGGSYWLGKYGEQLFVRGEIARTFTLGLINKDVTLACQMGANAGMPMFIGNLVRNYYQMAVNEFSPDMPVNNLAYLVEKMTNSSIVPKKAAE